MPFNSCVPIVTPFKHDLSLDYDSFDRYMHFLYTNSIRTIIIGGSTGESLAITNDERKKLIAYMKTNWSQFTLIGGIAAPDWPGTDAMIDAFTGCNALLVMPQLFIRPRKEDMRLFFSWIVEKAKAKSIQIILYNNPARLGVDMSDMYDELYDQTNVIGVKETSFDINQPSSAPNIRWWCGEDNVAIEAIKIGASGLISALSNLLPEISVKIAEKRQKPEEEMKWKLWSNCLQEYRNPVAVKYLLYKMGLISTPSLRFALASSDLAGLDHLVEGR